MVVGQIAKLSWFTFFLSVAMASWGCQKTGPDNYKSPVNKVPAANSLEMSGSTQELLNNHVELWKRNQKLHYRYQLLVGCQCRFSTLHDLRRIKTKTLLEYEHGDWLTLEVSNHKLITVTKEDGSVYMEYLAAVSQPYPNSILNSWTGSSDPIYFGFDVIQKAILRNADILQVSYNDNFGYPSEITIDERKTSLDDEFHMKITKFEWLD